jgi:hypothetical protein
MKETRKRTTQINKYLPCRQMSFPATSSHMGNGNEDEDLKGCKTTAVCVVCVAAPSQTSFCQETSPQAALPPPIHQSQANPLQYRMVVLKCAFSNHLSAASSCFQVNHTWFRANTPPIREMNVRHSDGYIPTESMQAFPLGQEENQSYYQNCKTGWERHLNLSLAGLPDLPGHRLYPA